MRSKSQSHIRKPSEKRAAPALGMEPGKIFGIGEASITRSIWTVRTLILTSFTIGCPSMTSFILSPEIRCGIARSLSTLMDNMKELIFFLIFLVVYSQVLN